jgi:CBS domain-containing protein
MTRDVDLVPPDSTIQAAATRMAEGDVGAILVGAQGRLQGILTDRDILIRVVIAGKDNATTRVGDVMSTELDTCSEDDMLEDAFEIMRRRQIRRLPVLSADRSLVGIVTLSDLAAHGLEVTPELLRRLAEPHRERDAETLTGSDS